MPKPIRVTPVTGLTAAERDVLILYGEGYDYNEIAQQRCSSWDTIKNQLDAARRKLNCTDSRAAYVELRRRERRHMGVTSAP